ncbi:MAG: serine/threonine-protein kinase, partial [Candidatus Sumerlaeia bacterium]|nr:serine/threonine-protein kinase [Candidatus Sumerlaeia bacterium]
MAEFPDDPTMSCFAESAGVDAPTPDAGALLSRWSVAEPAGGPSSGAAADAGGYVLRRVIGRGGMGEVWEALQVSLGRVVAVKRARSAAGEDTGGEHRKDSFRREAAFAALLEHPNIVPVHDLGRDDAGNLLLAMKLVDGRPWDRLLAEDLPALAPEELLAKHLPILAATAQAVAFAHAKGVVHRDLKPAQVMVGAFGEVLLMDWGLAFFTPEAPLADDAAEAARSLGLTTRETAANPSGTPALMAPEQTGRDTSRLGPWTDVYLLGGTLYYLLTGTYPHRGRTAMAALHSAARGEIEPPSRRAPGRPVPPELEALCLRALAADPQSRHRDGGGFLAELQDYLTGAGRRRESAALAGAAAGAPGRAGG